MRIYARSAWASIPALVMTASGFLGVLVGADYLGGNATLLGINDEQVRPLAHVLIYGSLALMLAQGLKGRYLLAWLLTAGLAGLDELHQAFLPSRYATLADWALSMLGATVFLVVGWFVIPYCHYRLERRRYRRALVAEGNWSGV